MSDIKEIKSEPNQAIIEILEIQLDKARSGKLQQLVMILGYDDGSTGDCFFSKMPARILGQMAITQRDIIDLEITTRLHEAGAEY